MSNVVRIEKWMKPAIKCHFKLAGQHGRGSNRRAVYVCKAHSYPNGCLPAAFNGFKVTK